MSVVFFRWVALSIFACATLFSISPAISQDISATDTGLLARQQVKIQQVENELRNLRGSISDDLQDVRTRLSAISERLDEQSISETQSVQKSLSSMASLEDTINLLEQRMRRTIEMSSDLDFRIIRLENKLQTLLSLSSEMETPSDANVSSQLLVPSDSKNTQSGSAFNNESNLISNDGSSWLIDQQKLEEQLSGSAEEVMPVNSSVDSLLDQQENLSAASPGFAESTDEANSQAQPNNAALGDWQDTSPNTIPQQVENQLSYILPVGTIEEQYDFAVKLALSKKLEEAAKAFETITVTYPEEPRAADSLFFLGRVQFMQKQYELAAYSFSEFNMNYPNDTRLVDSTLYLAKSVAEFADSEQACPILKSLPELLEEKSESFLLEMQLLSDNKQCENQG